MGQFVKNLARGAIIGARASAANFFNHTEHHRMLETERSRWIDAQTIPSRSQPFVRAVVGVALTTEYGSVSSPHKEYHRCRLHER